MRKTCIYLFILALLLGFGCVENPEKPPEVKPFIPSADGKITITQMESYIKASRALNEAMTKYSDMIKEFVAKYKVDADLSQMSDSTFMNSNPDVKKAWEDLMAEWMKMQEKAYKNAGIVEEEFNWIGGALTDSINTDIQKQVEKALTSVTEPEKDKGKKEIK